MSLLKQYTDKEKIKSVFNSAIEQMDGSQFIVFVDLPKMFIPPKFKENLWEVCGVKGFEHVFVFENYEKAVDFCKKNKIVNFDFDNDYLENCDNIKNSIMSNNKFGMIINLKDYRNNYEKLKEIYFSFYNEIFHLKEKKGSEEIAEEISEKYLNLLKDISFIKKDNNVNFSKYEQVRGIFSLFVNIGSINDTKIIKPIEFTPKTILSRNNITINHFTHDYHDNIFFNALKKETFKTSWDLINLLNNEYSLSKEENLLIVYLKLNGKVDKEKLDEKFIKELNKHLNPKKNTFMHNNEGVIKVLKAIEKNNSELFIKFLDENLKQIDISIVDNYVMNFYKKLYNEDSMRNYRDIFEKYITVLKEGDDSNIEFIEDKDYVLKKYKLDKNYLLNAKTDKNILYNNYLDYIQVAMKVALNNNRVEIQEDNSLITINLEFENENYNKDLLNNIMKSLFKNKGSIIKDISSLDEAKALGRELALLFQIKEQNIEKKSENHKRKI